MTLHDAKKQLALTLCHDVKKQLALALCKARTDVKLIRQYEPAYMLSEARFRRLVACEAPQIFELSADDELLSCIIQSEMQNAVKNAYAALVSEFN